MSMRQKGGKFSTGSTVASRLQDPSLDRIGKFSAERLDALKKKLSVCSVILNEIGLDYGAFVQNMKGMASLSVGGIDMMALRTRGSLFVLCKKPTESIYELAKGLGAVDFKRRCILKTPQDGHLYLSMITSGELARIMSVAAMEKKVPIGAQSIAPPSQGNVSLEEFRRKIANCVPELLVDSHFDPKAFAESLRFVWTFRDDKDQQHYVLIAGEEEINYRMYVNSDSVSALMGIPLAYGKDSCVLIKDGQQ